jgi:hypothetical protein
MEFVVHAFASGAAFDVRCVLGLALQGKPSRSRNSKRIKGPDAVYETSILPHVRISNVIDLL